MAIVLIDQGMKAKYPDAVNRIYDLLNPFKVEKINNIDHLYFESESFASNEIVLAKIYDKDIYNIRLFNSDKQFTKYTY